MIEYRGTQGIPHPMIAPSHKVLKVSTRFDLTSVNHESNQSAGSAGICSNGAEEKKGIVLVKQISLLYPLARLCWARELQEAEVGGTSSMTERDRNEALESFKWVAHLHQCR